ncbi:MAG: disulfide oxidoreductase [Firmicutes bacterium HGW-Firmicutes-16]|nr:MAG: disulfide oxidoreductase [Firmicutes bacterium HGW-Firmicutes-16]
MAINNLEVCTVYTITKDSILIEVLENAPQTAPFFNAIGMHCLTCVLATDETIEQACAAHGFDVDDFVMQVNNYLEEQEAQQG